MEQEKASAFGDVNSTQTTSAVPEARQKWRLVTTRLLLSTVIHNISHHARLPAERKPECPLLQLTERRSTVV